VDICNYDFFSFTFYSLVKYYFLCYPIPSPLHILIDIQFQIQFGSYSSVTSYSLPIHFLFISFHVFLQVLPYSYCILFKSYSNPIHFLFISYSYPLSVLFISCSNPTQLYILEVCFQKVVYEEIGGRKELKVTKGYVGDSPSLLTRVGSM
jgi:hypothetical protein